MSVWLCKYNFLSFSHTHSILYSMESEMADLRGGGINRNVGHGVGSSSDRTGSIRLGEDYYIPLASFCEEKTLGYNSLPAIESCVYN